MPESPVPISMNFMPPELETILRETPELRQSFLVGGCVRDALLDRPGKDFDVEVFGLNCETLARALARWGKTDLVGRSFGVVKLNTGGGFQCDFSVPRRDSKIAPGHKGFQIAFDSTLTPQDAAARRDFTINAMMFDPRARALLDYFGGQRDLEARVLRHTSPAFAEDPLRVLRGMQFAGRFALSPAPATLALCHEIKGGFGELAIERVREEWFKWADKSVLPSAGLKFLLESEWIDHFPEIKTLIGTPQEPEWHPEGDVFVHTCHCCDALVKLPEWQNADAETRIVLMLAVLAHDFGKPATTRRELRGDAWRIVSPGHEAAGEAPARSFLQRIGAPSGIVARVLPLVLNHLIHFQSVTDRAVRRLAKRLEPESIEHLCVLMTADSLGRPPRPPSVPEGVALIAQRARELEVRQRPPRLILMGRHLLKLGMTPGPEVGALVNAAYEAQLEGEFSDLAGALRWLENEQTKKRAWSQGHR